MIERAARWLAPAVLLTLAGTPATSIAQAAAARAQAEAPAAGRAELARLDALLAAGDLAAAQSLLDALAPELARDDRLAFDTIHLLLERDRVDDARAQWNRVGARLQERVRAAASAPPTDQTRRLVGEALFTQGLLLARAGEKAEALKLLQQADGLGFPALDSPLMLLAAGTLGDLQEYDLAAGAYRAFLQQQPRHAPARLGLASSLYALRKFADARSEIETLLHVAPDTPRAHYTLGAVLFEQHEHDAARAHLERELQLDARCTPCLSRLAHIAYLEGDDGRCEALLRKAAALDPEDVETHMVSGLLAARAGRYPAAIDHFTRVVARAPAYSMAHYQLAIAHQRAGNAGRAREHFDIYRRLLQEQKAREIGFRGEQ